MRLRSVVGVAVLTAAASCLIQSAAALPDEVITVLAPAGPSAPLPPAVGVEWVKAPVHPHSKINPDPVNPSGMLIEVSIAKQRLTAWSNGVVFMSGPIST